MATGSAAIAELEKEIAAVEKSQQPTRDRIAEVRAKAEEEVRALEAELAEGEATVARARAAIDVLSGRVSLGTGARRTSARSGGRGRAGGGTAAVIDALRSNPGSTAKELSQVLGVTPNSVSQNLKKLLEDGQVKADGGARNRKFSVA